MRKIFAALIVSFFVSSITINAQSEKTEPPPPPSKSKEQKVKFDPPKIVKDEELKTPPVITVKGKLADEFYERNPTVSGISRQGNVIMITKKDGTTEKYDMRNKEEDKNFKGKYGRSPIPPPPPKVIVTKT